MSHLLVCGASGFTNLGDDAILWGMLTQLRGAFGDRPVRVVGGPHLSSVTSHFGALALTYDDREELSRAIEDADLVVLGGGGMLYDIGYGATLARFLTDPPDRQWLYELARIAAAGRAAGKPVMCYAIGCGPLLTEAARRVAAFIAEQSSAVTVRDQSSSDLLRDCGVAASRIHVAADPAVLVEPGPAERADQWLSESGVSGLPKPWVAVNLRPWYRFGRDPAEAGDAMDVLVGRSGALVRGIRERLGGTAVLLPFQRLNDDDREVAARVAAAAGDSAGAVIADPPASPPDLAVALSRFDLAVGMRMHFLLLALGAGVPFVTLAYAPKAEEVARVAGLADHSHPVDDLDPEAVLASCGTLLSERNDVARRLKSACAQVRQAAEIPVAVAKALLESEASPKKVFTSRPKPTRPVRGMRVLMQIRPDFREHPGGDVVQLEELLPYLGEAGVTAELTGEAAPDLSGWDLVHTINLDRPDDPYRHCLNALRQGKPVVVSTVHTDMAEFLEWGNPDYWDLPDPSQGLPCARPAPLPHPVERRRRALEHLQRQAIANSATVALPNSEVDAEYLSRAFGLDLARCVVVPHGVSPLFAEARPQLFADKYRLEDFVLCVGRIEAKKNQLSLIAATRGTGLPLVIVGRPNPEAYLDLCRRYADNKVLFLDPLPLDELASAFAAARVHALVSWFEAPGLVSLEAASAGCNVVSTDRGSPPEYLAEHAWYCDPRSVDSIRQAVLAAYHAPRSDSLRQRIRENFTWERAAQRTFGGYQLALALWEGQDAGARAAASSSALQTHVDWMARQVADIEYQARQAHRQIKEAEGYIAHLTAWGQQWEEHSHALEAELKHAAAELEHWAAELKRWQEELDRIKARRLFRWSEAVARAVWGILGKLGVKP
jgi:polysaccharide pyruvyl transferase WcaK-like protein